MDNLYLQHVIIASCLGENQFKRVAFLEQEDFDNIKGKPFKDMWGLISNSLGSFDAVFSSMKNTNDRYLKLKLIEYSNYCVTSNIERAALSLMERTFRRTLFKLVTDISINTKEPSEALILSKTLKEVKDSGNDIFELIDGLYDYLEPYVSETTKSRLKEFQKYVDNRVAKVKFK